MGTIGVIDINPTRVLSCSRPFRVHGRTSLRGDLGEEEEEKETKRRIARRNKERRRERERKKKEKGKMRKRGAGKRFFIALNVRSINFCNLTL